MDIPLAQEDVVDSLWSAYTKTREYADGQTKAIPAHHFLIERQEKNGLRQIYTSFIQQLNSTVNAKNSLKTRPIGIWLSEWKEMNKKLFNHILKECGDWRKIDVRFGDPGDEDLYHIPKHWEVPSEMNQLAHKLCTQINQNFQTNNERFVFLAQIHYQFIRIHPFADGNGRIARAITDELSIFLGFPPAMAGYPRHDPKRRENYHHAIRVCADDAGCSDLAAWISGYINKQLEMIA